MKRKVILVMLSFMLILILSGCIPGDGSYTQQQPAGFFWGIWHGWLAPISVVIGFFNRDIRVYEVYNTGWPYDIGFYMAVISGFGGISLSRNKKKN
ncbi:hypothetical protein HYG86_07060 [Alkalicella caledoniensis]|uniref:Lipoprotein n=1 Tax=Alkalicella caledoniensis TaxID=2731377 RepID=A0A7G9W794_ALKCA|nr:hypothetical protein [Alkalicella caledoniensis]QNO14556.1 hypothetical protein HYG86_07060 [Alkalicella caledoniensis]